MDEEEDSREASHQRLKAALWFAVGKIVDEENVAKDLESFSSHAGRSTITTDDVLLLARRNEDLHNIIKQEVDQQKANKAKARKGKQNQ
ncbi:hypothetical protein PspLS_08841 [Pyricularia sp. CBS 133598]|nr:hypothetical protein PspLS_08841 [Pyricularia sp. CBS 133598]